MPSVPLPENPSLEHLKNQAKFIRDLARSGDQGAADLVVEFHPRFGDDVERRERIATLKLSDAQLAVARLYGFDSWPKLRSHVALVEEFARPDTADAVPLDGGITPSEDRHSPDRAVIADRFAALGCVSYSEVDTEKRLQQARAMVAADPELASASVAAMATAGDHIRLGQLIDVDPELITRPCGPNRWPLVLYCAYSRIEPGPQLGESRDRQDRGWSTLETARFLLERGADPNAGFLWRGLVPPFTALTGAFGRGESDQPPHHERLAMARLLLEAGADPNDGQTLYNNGLAGTAFDDSSHLELLVEFGLGQDQDGPWYRRFGPRLTSPQELVYDELEVAAHRGLPRRMGYLLSLGLDLSRGVGRSGRTPLELASNAGHDDIIAVLEQTT